MSAEELAAMDAKIVADTIAEMQRQIEQLTGARHSMYDPAVAIARDIANRTPPAMSADHIGDAGNMVAPVEAVAWRFWHEGGWNFSLADPSPHLADCVERDALYAHPAPIKPSGDTGELREKLKRAIWAQLPQEDANMGTSGRIADAILDLIQSERGKAVPMTAQELAEHAQFAFENDLPDDFTPYDCTMAWRRVGEHLTAVLAERAEG